MMLGMDSPIPPSTTRARLVTAAKDEFVEHGFAGTDSNKIARRAGFAPQTFYRWFKDKTDIFLAVYRGWEREEGVTIGRLIGRRAAGAELADGLIDHHRAYRIFRRGLKTLSLEDTRVRESRAASRRRQIAQIAHWSAPRPALAPEAIAVRLFEIERLADAVAEEEFADMGLGEAEARNRLAELFDELR
jgi:AcrR family transcriptional regulator